MLNHSNSNFTNQFYRYSGILHYFHHNMPREKHHRSLRINVMAPSTQMSQGQKHIRIKMRADRINRK